jgi:hypothetical protein
MNILMIVFPQFPWPRHLMVQRSRMSWTPKRSSITWPDSSPAGISIVLEANFRRRRTWNPRLHHLFFDRAARGGKGVKTLPNVIYEDAQATYYGGFLPFDFDFLEITIQLLADGIVINGRGQASFTHIWSVDEILDIFTTETSVLYAAHCRGHIRPSDIDGWEVMREAGRDPAPSVGLLVNAPSDVADVFDVRLVFRSDKWANAFVRHARRVLGFEDTRYDSRRPP